MRRFRYALLFIAAVFALTALVAWGQEAAPTKPADTPAPAPATPAQPANTTPAQPAQPAQPTQPATNPDSPFATPPTTPALPLLPEGPIDPDKVEVSIAFVKADLSNVLNFLSMASGVPIVLDAEVKGTVTITSLRKVSLTMAYEVINAALRVRGYTMVGTLKDQIIRVMPLKRSIADKAVVQFGSDPDKLGESDTVISQVIPLSFISATKLQTELKPLVADDQANLLAVSSSNALIVTDTEGNVKRMMKIIAMLDKDSSDVLSIEVYRCKFASATVLIASLEKIFGISRTNVAGQPQPQPQPNQPGAMNISTGDGVLSLKGEMRLSADDRTNAIIISASAPKIKMVLDLLAKLDVNTTPEVRSKTYRLTYADAQNVATQLNTLFQQPNGGIPSRNPFAQFNPMNQANQNSYAGLKENVVVADVRTNSVIVTATEQNLQEFDRMIQALDAPNVLSDISRTFQLKYAKAATVATTMTNLFRGSNSRMTFIDVISGNASTQAGDPIASLRRITVVSDDKTNTLLITGPPQVFTMVESIIAQLDRRTPQVFIEVAIVDVTLDDATKFGVEWTTRSTGKSPDGKSPEQSVGTDMGLASEVLGLKYSVISTNLQSLLYGLKTKSNVKVYSTPTITTADNVPATISIGQDVPFVSSSQATNGGNLIQTVDFKNVSIALNVTPHISEASGLISLDVSQTINELIGNEPTLNAPIIANRQAKTTVMVKNGETIVIGGIIKQNTERVTTGVPVLSNIPVLGEAFKSRSNKRTQSELMVFITPHILLDEASVQATTDEQRGKLSDAPPNVQVPTPPTTPAPAPAPPAGQK